VSVGTVMIVCSAVRDRTGMKWGALQVKGSCRRCCVRGRETNKTGVHIFHVFMDSRSKEESRGMHAFRDL